MLVNSLCRVFSIAKCVSKAHPTNLLLAHHFSSSSKLLFPRQSRNDTPDGQTGRRTHSVLEDDMEDLWDQLEEPADVEDSPSGGHIVLQQQREVLHYMRLIEHEMPKLVAYRKPFVPPTDAQPVIVRSMHYQGEPHPASLKRSIVVPVDMLPLKNEAAVHKLILLAGPRWSPMPSADAGVSGLDSWELGYIKIACESFPKASQNLKWASDTLDRLVKEANNEADTFAGVPVDVRHILARLKKQKKGDHVPSRMFQRPSIRDFPEEWLPQLSSS